MVRGTESLLVVGRWVVGRYLTTVNSPYNESGYVVGT